MTALLFLSSLLFASRSFAEEPVPPQGKQLNPVQLTGALPKTIDESSGVVRSRRYPQKDIFWTHNDSGDSARIFAIDGAGKLLREVAVPHAANRDWEEISIDAQDRLWICDIGDNDAKHKSFTLYRIPEPDALNANQALAEPVKYTFRYPPNDGPFDAEGLFVCDGYAYLFSKELGRTRSYRLSIPEVPPADNKIVDAEFLCETKTMSVVTGASLSDDHRHIALINYVTILVIDLDLPFEQIAKDPKQFARIFALPRRQRLSFLGQTEGVCFDGEDLVLTTECGKNAHLGNGFGHIYRLPHVLPVP